MRNLIYFLIFFVTLADEGFWTAVMAVLVAHLIWTAIIRWQRGDYNLGAGRGGSDDGSAWQRGSPRSRAGTNRRSTGQEQGQRSASYDFERGELRSAVFPGEQFSPIGFYVAALFLCVGRIAKAKGVVQARDIDVANQIMDRLGLPEYLREEARKRFNQGKYGQFDLDRLMAEVAHYFAAFPNYQRLFFDLCLGVAIVDGRLIPAEKEIMRKIFPLTGAPGLFFDTFVSQFEQGARRSGGTGYGQGRQEGGYSGYRYGGSARGSSQGAGAQSASRAARHAKLNESLAILGVDANVTQQELTRAYRRLINQYHPDKLAGQNLPEGMVEMAKEKTQQIIAAYDYIMEVKGWSR